MNPEPLLFQYTIIIRDLPNLTYVLPMAPDGWEENAVNWSRDTKFFGMVRKFTTQLKFVTESAELLRREFYTYGLFANVKVKIEKRNNSWAYDQVFYGQIDFSNVNDQKDFFVANAINLGIEANIAAYADTTYELPLDLDAVTVNMPGLNLFEQAILFFSPSESPANPGFPATTLISNEVNASQASVKAVPYSTNFAPNFTTDANWTFKATTNTTVNINITDLSGNVVRGVPGAKNYQLQIVRSDGVQLASVVNITTDESITPFSVSSVSYAFNLTTGQSLFFYFSIDIPSTEPFTGWLIDTGQINLSYYTSTPASPIKAFRAIDVLKKLLNHINQGVDYPIQSNYLVDIQNLLITCGEFIRGITTKTVVTETIDGPLVTVLPYTPLMKTSLNDFYQSLRAVSKNSNYGVGMGVENGKLVFEDLSYFFKNVQICHIDNIQDFGNTPYIEYIFNTISAGYPNQTYNSQLNGRYEINSQQEYTSPLLQIGDSEKKLDLTSVYRADAYGIEEIRVLETDTTNDYSDNDVFFIDAKNVEGNYEPITVAEFTNVTGTIAGQTLYNLDITPHRNLLRNGGFLRSALNADGYLIGFASGLKNTDVSSINPDGIYVKENTDIDIATLPNPLFYPYVVTINTDYPKNMIQMLDAFVGGYISFDYRGNTYKGYPIDVTTDITKNSAKELKLLMTYDNNLLNLVHR